MLRMMGLIIGLSIATTALALDFTITSNSFSNNGKIPLDYTCDGKNISPELHWENSPAGVQSFALIFSCPDCTSGMDYLWVIYNIPSDAKRLNEGANVDLPEDVLVGNNSFGDAIYRGPCAPDNRPHHYVYTLYALDTKLYLSSEVDPQEVLDAIKHHILKQATLFGISNY